MRQVMEMSPGQPSRAGPVQADEVLQPQRALAVQMLLARYVRAIAEPDALDE